MKRTIALGLVATALSAFAQGELKQVVETQSLDPKASAELQAFKQKVAAANPGLDVVKIEADVIKRAVLAPPPPPRKTPVMAVFVKNHTKTAGMDDEVDGVRDRLAAEVSGLGFAVMDSAEIGAAFNRYKITTQEERAGLIAGLFTGGSVTRVAQMLGADYILTASIIGASAMSRSVGYRAARNDAAGSDMSGVTIFTLRMATKVLDATTGASVYGKNWSGKQPTTASGDDPMAHYNDLIDSWVSEIGEELEASRASWRAPTADSGMLASFTVTTTLDDVFRALETTVDASKPVKDELRIVAGGCTVEIDGAAVGSSGGTFKARPGLHQMRVSRQWMTPWTGTVNIVDGASFNVALELSSDGFQHYRNKEVLRAELALSYAEAAFRRGCRINYDTANWQNVTWAPGAQASSVSSSTVLQPTMVQPVLQAPTVAVPQAPTLEMPQSQPVQMPQVQSPQAQPAAVQQ